MFPKAMILLLYLSCLNGQELTTTVQTKEGGCYSSWIQFNNYCYKFYKNISSWYTGLLNNLQWGRCMFKQVMLQCYNCLKSVLRLVKPHTLVSFFLTKFFNIAIYVANSLLFMLLLLKKALLQHSIYNKELATYICGAPTRRKF
jgi:hypothetical protein